ncbi:MAG: ROK family protein, partial [Chloroflexi bacterium]|nr:ROK family protein [Chloroflexota bacterium]
MSEQKIAAGVDLGGTKILSIVATADGRVLAEDRRPTLAADGPEAVIERIVASLRKAIDEAGVTTDAIAGAGISTPGPCDPARGVVVDAPNLPGWRNVELARIVSEQLGAPAVLEHDAAAACYGEYRYGAGRGSRHIVYATLGTGIGGGIIIDGRIYHGASGAAGEIGHIIVDPEGPACNCGGRGCVEAFASGVAIARDAAAAMAAGRSSLLAELAEGREPDAELVLTAAQQGDETA